MGGANKYRSASPNAFQSTPSPSPIGGAAAGPLTDADEEPSLSSTLSFTVTKSNVSSRENRFDRGFAPSAKVQNHSNPMQHPAFCRSQSLFWIFWSIFWLEMYIVFYLIFNEKQWSNEALHNDVLFGVMLVAAVILKWCIKRLSRTLDECRITADHIQLSGSLEMMMEFICSMMYWTMFRVIIGFVESSSISLLVILISHFGSECWQSTWKFTDFYFNKTKRIKYPDFWKWLEDHTNICQWRVRLSLDVAIRFNVVILSGIFQILVHLAVSYGMNDSLNVTSWTAQQGFVKTILVFALEIVYYLTVTFALNSCKFRVSALSLLMRVMQFNGKNVRIIGVYCAVVVTMVYMFAFIGILN